MATLKGFRANEIKPQPGFAPKCSENGGWSGVHRFAITRQSFDNTAIRNQFSKGTAVTALDPDVPTFFSFMKLTEPEVSFGEGNIVWITATFAGAESGQFGNEEDLAPSALPTYELDGTLGESLLSDHRYWKDLPEDDKIALGFMLRGEMIVDRTSWEVGSMVTENNALKFKRFEKMNGDPLVITSEHGKSYARRISRDVVTYLRPSFQWRERTEGSSGLTEAQLNKLGEISTPRGSPPTPTGGRNWRLDSANQWSEGEKVTTELVWSLSERGGFDSFLYGDGSDPEAEEE